MRHLRNQKVFVGVAGLILVIMVLGTILSSIG